MKKLRLLCLIFLPLGSVSAHEGTHKTLDRFNNMLLNNPANAWAYFQRAELLVLHGDLKQAEDDYIRALLLDPKKQEVRLELGKLYLRQERFEQSRQVLDVFLRTNKSNEEARLYHARALAGLKKYQPSFNAYTALINTAKQPMPWMYAERAGVHELLAPNDLPKVMQGVEEGIAKLGHFVELDLALLKLEMRLGQTEKALARFDYLIGIAPLEWTEKKALYLKKVGRATEADQTMKQLFSQLQQLPAHRLGTPHFSRQLKRVKQALEVK